jgi:hypothetical protein
MPVNFQAADAFRSAKTLTALYTRLDIARDAINLALESLPPEFDANKTVQQITIIRNKLSYEMRGIWDLRASEERRICEQIAHPAPPVLESQITAMSEVTFSPDQNQFPPLADPDSLPDPPVIAGPDDNTPNFIQIDNHGIPPITFFQLDESQGFTKIPNPAMRLTGM